MTNRERPGIRAALAPSSPAGADEEIKLSLRQRQKEMTRRRIITSALTIFAKKSFTATTLEDIAAAGSVSRPTVYAHFGNKGEILRAAIDELPEFDPLLTAIVEAEGYDARCLAFRELSDFWHDHLSELWKYVREAAAIDPQIMAWIEYFALTYTQMIKCCLEQHGVPSRIAHARAFLIWCSWHEYLFWINRPLAKPDREAMVEALSHDFESALASGDTTCSR